MKSQDLKATAPRRCLQTSEAAAYIGVSASLLRKWRMRAPDDPQEKGPSYFRIGPQTVLYELEELNRWLDAHAARTGRAA